MAPKISATLPKLSRVPDSTGLSYDRANSMKPIARGHSLSNATMSATRAAMRLFRIAPRVIGTRMTERSRLVRLSPRFKSLKPQCLSLY
jgi:hypothetical protein